MPTVKPRRIRLHLTHRTSDHPSQLTAWGRVRGGEVALVLRADTGQGMLVHRTGGKKPESRVWRCDGPVLEAPNAPVDVLAEAPALSRFKKLMGSPEAGPVTMRGQWTGVLEWTEGAPVIELWRKLSTYGKLWVRSQPGLGWSWRFEREAKWFSDKADDESTGLASLTEAVEAGYAGARVLLGTACSFRDSHRRAAHDDVYAERHPIRTPAATRNALAERIERETATPAEPKRQGRASKRKSKASAQVQSSSLTTRAGRRRKAATAPEAPRRQPTAQTRPTPEPTGNHAPDADKDSALLSLFQQAVTAAVEGA